MGERKEILSEYTLACFDAFAEREKLAPQTRRKYLSLIRIICKEFGKDFMELTDKEVYRYHDKLEGMVREGELCNRTLRARFYSYVSFASYLVEIGRMEHSAFDCINLPEVDDTPHSLNIPTLEECDAVIEMAERSGEDMALIFLIVLRMGLTASEICNLKTSSLMEFDGKLYFEFNRGEGNCRYMEIPDDLRDRIKKYHSMNSSPYFFLNSKGEKLQGRALEKRVKKIVSKAGCEPFTLRDLRNRCIYQMLHDGVREEEVAAYNDLSPMRVRTFANAPFVKSQALSVCPPNLSRIRVV